MRCAPDTAQTSVRPCDCPTISLGLFYVSAWVAATFFVQKVFVFIVEWMAHSKNDAQLISALLPVSTHLSDTGRTIVCILFLISDRNTKEK